MQNIRTKNAASRFQGTLEAKIQAQNEQTRRLLRTITKLRAKQIDLQAELLATQASLDMEHGKYMECATMLNTAQTNLSIKQNQLEHCQEELAATSSTLQETTQSLACTEKELEIVKNTVAGYKQDALENIELAESYYKDKQDLSERLHLAESKAATLEAQLEARRAKPEQCLIQLPDIQEKYHGEFKFAIMSAIHRAVDPLNQTGGKGKKSSSQAIRSQDVWNAFIETNPEAEAEYREFNDTIEKIIAATRKGDLQKSPALLKPFHLKFACNANNHNELHFDDCDDLYSATSSSTPSDTRSQLNSCRDIKNTFFF